MRRIGRRMLNGLTALSLVLCVGTCVKWIRTYQDGDEYLRQGKVWYVAVISGRGMLSVHGVDISPAHTSFTFQNKRVGETAKFPYDMMWPYYFNPPPMEPGVRSQGSLPGLRWRISDGSSMLIGGTTFSKRWDVYLSYWLVALLMAGLPIARLTYRLVRREMIHRRIAGGVCPDCSYDLTGNASGVCPECGKTIAQVE